MKTDLFYFNLPDYLIAQKPSKKRSDSRLLVYYRNKDIIIDSYTKNLCEFINKDYFLVFNNSKVIPARLNIKKKENNRNGELLVLKIINEYEIEVLMDKAKKYPDETVIILPQNKEALITKTLNDGVKLLKSDKPVFTINYLDKNGYVPLPPYIRNKKTLKFDRDRYQTTFSKIYGSSAAPTAGLHFDKTIFNSLKKHSIDYAFVSLHVGLGTFQPIYTQNIEEHKIHEEEYFIERNEADKINKAINNKKIIPVGTTSLRTLETAYNNGKIKYGNGVSNLYIYPSYKFEVADGLLTNFHTPKSSLLVLVSAILGRDKLFEIYDYAIKKEYRFFSYGDAMLIL